MCKIYNCLQLQHINEEMTEKNERREGKQEKKLLTVIHPQTLPGHTGFITIATLPPSSLRYAAE